MTTAGTKTVVNTGKGKMDNAPKKLRWVWRPKGNYMDHESKEKGSFILKKFEYVDQNGNPILYNLDHAVVDSGCSSHMTGNKAYLSDYEDYNGGFVAFGNELKFNLFSVSQMCDKKNSVLFTNTKCLILSPSFKLLDENQVVLKAPRQNDQANVAGSGPDWKFDLNFLTNTMNYIPVSVENQVNVDAGTQEYYVAGSSEKDKEPSQEYILLPLHPYRPRILVEDVIQAAKDKPSENFPKDNDVQDSEEVVEKEEQHMLTEADQALQNDLERMIAQEIAAKAMDDATKQSFEEEKKRAAQATSINKLNTSRPSVSTSNSPMVSTANTPYASPTSTPTGTNTGGSSFVYLGGQIPIDASTLPNADLPIDPNMPDLEDDSNVFPNDGIFSGAYDDEDVGAEADFNNMDNTIDVSPNPTLKVHKDHFKGQILRDPKSTVQTRGKIQKSSSVQQALKVWILVDLPFRKKAIGTKWVFRNKRDGRSIVVKNKARIVAQGFRQEEGIDYDEVFAPVARIEAIRLFLAFASFMEFLVYQMDVKSAFLYGTIEEEVYVHQPPGFVDPAHPNKVYKVIKALYGLHEAPRAWYETLSSFLLENGFRRSTIDKTLFIKKNKNDIMLVQVYVDDIIFGSTKQSMCTEFEDCASLDRKSTRGCQFLGRRLISWQCKKQTIMANSTTEAEYVAAANCFNNPIYHSRTKHIEIRHHFIRDCYEKRLIDVIKIHTDANVADLLTKGFDVTRFNFLVLADGCKRYVMLFGLRIKVSMANLEFVDQHNMVACLEKTSGNSNFYEMVDYLASSSIHHALSVSPPIYTSYIEQFWNTASSQTVNDVKQINATVDSKAVVVIEASIKSSLLFNDADAEGEDSRDSLEKTNGNEGDQVQIPHDSPLSGGQTSYRVEGALNLQELSVLCTNLSNRVLALESIKDAQAVEISALKSRIKKLEKKCKPSISHHRAWLKSVKRLSMKKRFGKQESVSKQGRKKSKPESTLDDSTVFEDQDADHGMEYMEIEEAVDEGRQSHETEEVKLTDDTEVVEYKSSGDKGGNVKELVSTARPEVSTARPDIDAARQEDSVVEPRTPPTTTSIFDDEDITMAQTLIKMKEEKAKEKGVSFKDIKDSSRPERSILTLKPLLTIDPKDKGKSVLKELEPAKKMTKSDFDAAQIARDAEIARQLQVDLQAEVERERQREEEASKAAIAEMYDEVQAGIDVDALFAAKLQQEEREEYIIEERAKFLAETIAAQRKFRAAQRSAKIRSMYERQKKFVQDFVPIGFAKEEELIKKMNEKATNEDTSNKEKVLEEPDSTKVEVKQE
ncbi:putative ribonuclease H-like domain-containing protein [Tanacetum coccineum]|uniref:Ribonuclease H-like domain-containing protein n=1 Tax=Tanacetum coccineum TaxID=301880 RepID=A0ABQ5B125_9ASTR